MNTDHASYVSRISIRLSEKKMFFNFDQISQMSKLYLFVEIVKFMFTYCDSDASITNEFFSANITEILKSFMKQNNAKSAFISFSGPSISIINSHYMNK